MIIGDKIFTEKYTIDCGAPQTYFDLEQDFSPLEHCEIVKKEISKPKDIILREDVSLSNAKDEITNYLKHHKGEVFISDIMQELKLSLRLVIDVLEQLYDEGYIDRTD